MRSHERIPIHDHSGLNSGGLVASSTTVHAVSEVVSTTATVGYGSPVATGTALAGGSSALAARADHGHTNSVLGTVVVSGTAAAGLVLTGDSATAASWQASAASVIWYDEGSLAGTAGIVNLVGSSGTVAVAGGTATITLTAGTAGGSGSVVFYDEGSLAGTAAIVNVTGSGGTLSVSGGTATLNITGGSGTVWPSAFGSAVMTTPGLAWYWPMQDASGPAVEEIWGNLHGHMNSVGSAVFGTATGTVTTQNKAIVFNGVGNYIATPGHQQLQGAVTVGAWVRGTATGRRPIYNSRANGQGIDFGWGATGGGHGGNGQFRIAIDATGVDYGRHTTAAYNDGNWHFAVAVIGPTDIGAAFGTADFKVYVDGTAATMASGTTGSPSSPITIAQNVTTYAYIGRAIQALSYWSGDMAHVFVYRRALGTAEISALYTAGTAA